MLDTIFKHKSIRQYSDKIVQKQELDEILLAATRASNTGNMQLYSIIVTQDPDLKTKLWESHFKQEMVRQAPVVLTFCADINRFNQWCDARNANHGYDNFLWFYNATIDATIAAQNATLAAETKNMGVCYLGTTTYMAQQIIDILELPKGVVPVTTLVIGYPNEDPQLTDRLPLEAIVHNEKYEQYSTDRINQLYEEKENLVSTQQLIEENKTDNLAQIFTEKRYKKEDNIHFSNEFMEVVRKQGFIS